MPTVLFNGVPKRQPVLTDETAAIVVALKTRTMPVKQAVNESMAAFSRLKDMGAQHLYLKYCSTFDSTSEGNIGSVADAVMEKWGIPYTVLCTSLPVNGRTVQDGNLYVNGIPLAESHIKDHPLTPMRNSFVPKLMEAQSKYGAHVLGLEQMTEMAKAKESNETYIENMIGKESPVSLSLKILLPPGAECSRHPERY